MNKLNHDITPSSSPVGARGRRARLSTAASAVLLMVCSVALPAAAHEWPGTPQTSVGDFRNCPLARVGDQFVRCDNLTGAGSLAPAWVPER